MRPEEWAGGTRTALVAADSAFGLWGYAASQVVNSALGIAEAGVLKNRPVHPTPSALEAAVLLMEGEEEKILNA